MLGTGAPPPTVEKNGPSNGIISDEKLFLIDAGRNVATQAVRAGFPVSSIDNIIFTHFLLIFVLLHFYINVTSFYIILI